MTQSDTQELKSCPFCGGEAAWGEGEQKTKYGNEQVYCSDCYAITAPEGSKAEAAKNWNDRPLIDSQAAGSESFTAAHFTFGPCFHSMVKPDCSSCCRSHAIRMEQQLGKLEASTVLPERERIEKAIREHMAHCYQVYKGVPPTVDDWIGGALHYVMWGLERDVPLPPDAATTMRDQCVAKVESMADDWVLLWQKDLTGDHADKLIYAQAARKVAAELSSLTLEVKQEKESK